MLQRICADDTEVLDLIDRVVQGKHAGNGSNQYASANVDNVHISTRPTGNDRQRALRRLRKDSQLAEIDENLIRNELSALERGEQLSKRKGLYEAKYPQTKNGAKGGRGNTKTQNFESAESALSFVKDTAAKTKQSARTIAEDVQIAKEATPESIAPFVSQCGSPLLLPFQCPRATPGSAFVHARHNAPVNFIHWQFRARYKAKDFLRRFDADNLNIARELFERYIANRVGLRAFA